MCPFPANPWAGFTLEAFRHRPAPRRWPRRRWVARSGCVAAAVLLFTSYSTGVSYGHWALQASAEAQMGTGTLDLDVTDPPSFTFECTSQVFPKHAISFVRFWDPPALPPEEPLTPAKPGAVKIEEGSVEFGGGPYSVEPPGAHVGDPLTVHLGGITVIISWVPKPGEPGEWVGFSYQVSGGASVVVDVKAGQSLTRHVISGVGMWPPEGLFPGDGAATCDPASQSGRADLHNCGTVPAAVRLQWDYGPSADPTLCGLFDVLIRDGGSGATLFEGSLCGLLGSPVPLSLPLDPDESMSLDIVVTLLPGAVPSGPVTLPLTSHVTFWQWTSGSPGAYGWWGDSPPGSFEIEVVFPTPLGAGESAGAGTAGPMLLAEGVGEEIEEAGPPPEETTTTTTTTTLPAEETTTWIMEVLFPEEATTTTTTTLPPPEEPATLTLRGRAWEDLDGDGVTVVGHPDQEPAGGNVEVVLRAEDGTWLASTLTDTDGIYRFDDLDPGNYRIEFRAPEGFGFRDPAEVITLDAARLAEDLDIPVEQVVLDDLNLAPVPGEGEQARAETAAFDFDAVAAEDGGDTDGVADAAMVRLPEPSEEGEGGEETAPPEEEAESGDLPTGPTDPNTQASQPEEPQPQQTVGVDPGDGGDGGSGVAGGDEVVPPANPPDDGGAPGEGGGALP